MFRIREMRERKGISMKEAARLLNMPYTTYVNYEKEQREPTSEVLIQLADFYDTTIDYLIGRTNVAPDSHRQVIVHTPAPELSRSEAELLRKFRQLDTAGQGRVLNVLDYEYANRPGMQADPALQKA